jgi:hypothetical protein
MVGLGRKRVKGRTWIEYVSGEADENVFETVREDAMKG